MQHLKVSVLTVTFLGLASTVALRTARADEPQPGEPPVGAPQENPIPPNAEGQAIPSQNGGYCFGGPHPAPGGGWEAMTTPHVHDYAPFDLRLFQYHEGCYYFVGDPRDFGYTGETFSYYGAHPIADGYGGGWCFMIGAHSHWWRPWSPNFTVVGPWYYWNGPYDPFFWSYWPYYSFYYRSYYPSYYSGGRYSRTWRAAPGISRVPPTTWRGSPGNGGAWRGSPGAARGGQPYGSAPGAGGWRGAPVGGNAWRAAPQSSGGGWRGSPVPNTSPLRGSPGGGWHPAPSGGGGWHSAPSGGGWHGAPSGGGFRGGGGGGFHSGGGFRGGRH
ncbi:MAG: hypothetical protein JWM82_449 [Myxococcales bacterium]|nr:hypothetical protein [Myxococcales bacterium]